MQNLPSAKTNNSSNKESQADVFGNAASNKNGIPYWVDPSYDYDPADPESLIYER